MATCQGRLCDSQPLQSVQIICCCSLHGPLSAGQAPSSCLCKRVSLPTDNLRSIALLNVTQIYPCFQTATNQKQAQATLVPLKAYTRPTM